MLTHPNFRRRPTPRGVNDADRHIEGALDIASEVISDGREVTDLLRTARLPLGRNVVDGGERPEFWNRVKTQQRIGGLGDFGLGFEGCAHGPLHVRLATGDPHLADQHIADLDPILGTLDDQLLGRCVSAQFRQLYHPASVLGFGLHVLLAEGDCHGFPVIGPSPDGHTDVALQHHVIGEKSMNANLGGCEERRGESEHGREAEHSTLLTCSWNHGPSRPQKPVEGQCEVLRRRFAEGASNLKSPG